MCEQIIDNAWIVPVFFLFGLAVSVLVGAVVEVVRWLNNHRRNVRRMQWWSRYLALAFLLVPVAAAAGVPEEPAWTRVFVAVDPVQVIDCEYVGTVKASAVFLAGTPTGTVRARGLALKRLRMAVVKADADTLVLTSLEGDNGRVTARGAAYWCGIEQ